MQQSHADNVEGGGLKTGYHDRRLVAWRSVYESAVEVYFYLDLALVLWLFQKAPVDNGAVRFDASEIDKRVGGNIESEEVGEIAERFLYDLRGPIGEPGGASQRVAGGETDEDQ